MNRFYLVILLSAFLIIPSINKLSAESKIKSGDIVFAEWSVNGWYHGTVGEECDAGSFMIFFDDSDTKCCQISNIVKDVVPQQSNVLPGVKVLAQWTDGKFYPGTVSVINNGTIYINFDDGDKRQVTLDQIRLR